MLDIYKEGSISRISPEAPVPVLLNTHDIYAAGGAGNVAVNLASMGCEITLAGIIGNDKEGEILKSIIHEQNIAFRYLISKQAPTISKTRIISAGKHLVRIDKELSFENESGVLFDSVKDLDPGYVVISDYNKGTLSDIRNIIFQYRKKNIKVFVDPKRSMEHYRGAWLIKPNKTEFERYVGTYNNDSEIVMKGRQALLDNDIEHMLVTLGAKGMIYINHTDHEIIPARSLKVYDITGAGDTVISTLVYEVAKGNTIRNAIVRSRDMAGISVSHFGTYVIKPSDMQEYS